MSSNIFRKKTISRVEKKYNYLGKKPNTLLFLNIRLIICLLIFVLFLIISKLGFIIGPIVSIILYYLIEYLYFDLRIRTRKKQIENDALIFFGLLLLSLKSENNLIMSLSLASKKKDNILSLEFTKLLNDLEYGKSFADALNDIIRRIPNENVNNLILSLKEYSDNVGNLIILLNRQLSRLEEKIIFNKKKIIILIPLKIKILSFVFILISGILIFYTLKGFDLF